MGTIVITKQRHLQNGLKHTRVQFEHSLLPHNFAHQGKDAPKYYSLYTPSPWNAGSECIFFSELLRYQLGQKITPDVGF